MLQVITKAHNKLLHPPFPEKKDKSDFLTNKDLRERSCCFEKILKFWIQEIED